MGESFQVRYKQVVVHQMSSEHITEASQANETIKICPVCGKEVVGEGLFCGNCNHEF